MLMTNNDGDDEDRNEPREPGPKEWEWKWVHRSARFLGTRRSVACLLNETNQPTNPFHSIPSSQSSSHLPAQDPVPCKKPLEHWSASAVDVTDQRTVKRADGQTDGQIRLLRSSVVFNFLFQYAHSPSDCSRCCSCPLMNYVRKSPPTRKSIDSSILLSLAWGGEAIVELKWSLSPRFTWFKDNNKGYFPMTYKYLFY